MIHKTSPFFPAPTPPAGAVEYRDDTGRPLLFAPASSAPRLGLISRHAGLILHAPGPGKVWRTHLRHNPPDAPLHARLWDISALGVLGNEAVQDAGLRLAQARLSLPLDAPVLLSAHAVLPPAQSAAILPPARFGRTELTLLWGRLATLPASTEADLWLDADETRGFMAIFADQLSPLLALAAQLGLLLP